jgi:hypothetical protein
MRRSVIALALGLLAVAAHARPMEPPLPQQLLALYDRYNRAIEAGNVDQALDLRSGAVRAAVTQAMKTPQDRTDFVNASREMVPDRLDLEHASVNDAGDKALLIALATKTLPGRREQNEFDLGFVKEDGVWKLGALLAGPGPADIKRCSNQGYQTISAYAGGQRVALVGRIERVEYMPDYTLVLVANGVTEVCAFLPDRAALQQHGLNPAIMQPWRLAEITGVAEKDDPQKVMVDNITVHSEE